MKAVHPRRSARVDVHDHLAVLGELDGVRQQVEQHLPQPGRVADDPGGHALLHEAAELDLLLGGSRGDHVERRLDAFAQVDGRTLELELARLYLRVVEDVVDHVEQGVSARAHHLGELALLGRQLGAEQEAGHPDHRVHRRPDLVAHRREERALGLRGGLCLLPRALKLRDVVVDPVEPDVFAVDAQRDEHHLDVDELTVLAPALSDPLLPAGLDGLAGEVSALVLEPFDDEFVDRTADRLLG